MSTSGTPGRTRDGEPGGTGTGPQGSEAPPPRPTPPARRPGAPVRTTRDLSHALDAHAHRRTLTSRAAWVTLLLVTVLSIAADLGSKWLAFRFVAPQPVVVDRAAVLAKSAIDPRAVTEVIPPHQPRVIIPHVLEFTLVLNPGAVFGIGPGQRWFFIGFTGLALGFAMWMFLRWTGPDDRWGHVGIAMLIGGGLGNLYDRLTYACVRDFIHPLPGLKWPGGWKPLGSEQVWPYVSNLADLILLIGIIMLLVILWKRDKTPA